MSQKRNRNQDTMADAVQQQELIQIDDEFRNHYSGRGFRNSNTLDKAATQEDRPSYNRERVSAYQAVLN